MQPFTYAIVFFLGFALVTGGSYDLHTAIYTSLMFYQAQRSGKLYDMDPLVSWRKDSALNDRGQNGEDLTGGYYDAGDYVKFGLPMAYTITLLAWGAIDYESTYRAEGQLDEVRRAIKWGTDYFIKAHVSPNEFYGQVGNGDIDHAWFGRPEDMTMERPAYKIDVNHPGSDLAAETAAALAAASITFRYVDPSYSNTLLNHAKQLYDFADKYRGKYSDSIPDAAQFYRSDIIEDELVWGAAWLYRATNDQNYLNKALQINQEFGVQYKAVPPSWGEKSSAATVLLAKLTGDNSLRSSVQNFCDAFYYGQTRTPKGLIFYSDWGSLRQAANGVWVCLQAADIGISPDEYRAQGKQQIDYALGDTGRSFVVGFGYNAPTHASHASSSCPDAPAPCDFSIKYGPQENYHVLYGALVGGPDVNDNYVDSRTDYVHNEVATDYNAPFQNALVALKALGY